MTFDEWMGAHMQEHGDSLSYTPKARLVWEAATKAEREACAVACECEAVDAAATNEQTDHAYNAALTHAAAAIRARQ